MLMKDLAELTRIILCNHKNDIHKRYLDVVYPVLLRTVMNHCKGNQSKATELLGINRGTLRKKLKRYNIK